MLIEIISGLIGGLLGPFFGKIIGKFRLWKVFVITLLLIYVVLFVMGLVLVGFNETISRFNELFEPSVLTIFFGLASIVTFVAFVGGDARKNAQRNDLSGREK